MIMDSIIECALGVLLRLRLGTCVSASIRTQTRQTRVWVAFPSYHKIAFGSTGVGSNSIQYPPIHVGIQQHHRTPGRENLLRLTTPPLATRHCHRSLPFPSRRRRQADEPQPPLSLVDSKTCKNQRRAGKDR
jgi:hypothetical protein